MILTINKNIYLKSFKTEKELRETILEMILKSKPEKIIYKGNPKMINYKTLKKIVSTKEEVNLDSEFFKDKYSKIIENLNEDFCVIYKE